MILLMRIWKSHDFQKGSVVTPDQTTGRAFSVREIAKSVTALFSRRKAGLVVQCKCKLACDVRIFANLHQCKCEFQFALHSHFNLYFYNLHNFSVHTSSFFLVQYIRMIPHSLYTVPAAQKRFAVGF
jgi:hypothetical protein